MKKIMKWLIILIVLLCISLGSWIIFMKNSDSTIGNIAFDRNKFVENTIYLKENDKYVQYIVVTNNYQGNTLLLRKDCLSTKMRMSEYSSYYENCEVDKYLNSEYINNFSESLKDKIVCTNLEIISEDSIGTANPQTITINRKAFILSTKELGFDTIDSVEGKSLKYFKNVKNRVVFNNDHSSHQWLRTPATNYVSMTYYLNGDNSLQATNSFGNDLNGSSTGYLYIRPAICINSNTKIEKNIFIVKGRAVYVLSE